MNQSGWVVPVSVVRVSGCTCCMCIVYLVVPGWVGLYLQTHLGQKASVSVSESPSSTITTFGQLQWLVKRMTMTLRMETLRMTTLPGWHILYVEFPLSVCCIHHGWVWTHTFAPSGGIYLVYVLYWRSYYTAGGNDIHNFGSQLLTSQQG